MVGKTHEVVFMKRRIHLRRLDVSPKAAAIYLALLFTMFLLNCALPQKEPLSFALAFAALSCGLDPFVCGGSYLIASALSLSAEVSLSAAVQAAFLTLVFCIYKRLRRPAGYERALYALVAQLPFIFLFPHTSYSLFPFAVVWQKTVIAAFVFLISLMFDGGLHALLFRAFRCRLSAHALAEICLIWVFAGMGVCNAAGISVFYAVSLFPLLAAVFLLKNAAAVPFAVALSLPLCVTQQSALPCAAYAAFSCVSLLFVPYGKCASALSLFGCFLVSQYFEGLFATDGWNVALRLIACAAPAVLLVCLPEKYYRKANRTLLFYRERTLPRIAVNRQRRAVGEQLYEVSSLFREIETAFTVTDAQDNSDKRIRETLIATLCKDCPNRRKCERSGAYDALDKLIAVGCAKGRVNLIDLPADLSSQCANSAGLMFALNKQLAEYRRYAVEMESARAGRKLLAEQARGVSDILRDIALEQSEEYVFSEDESLLSKAFASAGILCSELFLYGEGNNVTVSVTASDKVSGKRLCDAAKSALKTPFALAEKIPLTSDRSCFILRKKPQFDAAFGVASVPKEGTAASGDTHSILRIDERRFIVALSDGMGSGEAARAVSDHTLTLLESFYKAKMPSEIVLSTVNRLIAYSSDETFSCLDLAAVNLDTGIADFVKIGSPAGYLLSGEELRVLEGESLPLGMLEAVHPATMRAELKEDDFLLFMSDGVSSAFGSTTELFDYLSGQRPLNPQSFAEELLSAALARYGGKAEDDMTVLAVRLLKAA